MADLGEECRAVLVADEKGDGMAIFWNRTMADAINQAGQSLEALEINAPPGLSMWIGTVTWEVESDGSSSLTLEGHCHPLTSDQIEKIARNADPFEEE